MKKNMLLNVLLKVTSILFPMITFPYVSRILEPAGIGRASFANSFVAYFAMFAQLGIPVYGIRECAKVRDDKLALTRTAHELLFINMVASAAATLVFVIAVFTVPKLRDNRWMLLLMGVSISLRALGAEWLYSGMEDYEYIVKRQILCNVMAAAGVFLFINGKEDELYYGILLVFSSSAAGVFNFLNLKKYIDLRWVGGYRPMRHIRMIMTFFGLALATVIYTCLDTVMLGFMNSDEQVGFYTIAVKIRELLVSVLTSVSAVLLPRASYYVEQERYEEFFTIIRNTMRFIIILAVPSSVYFILFAPHGIGLFAGDAYGKSVLSMRVIMPVVVFISITNIIGIQLCVPLGKEKEVLKSVILGATTDLVINAVMIPRYGSVGAAIGTLIAEGMVLIYQLRVCCKLGISVMVNIPWGHVMAGALLAGGISYCMTLNIQGHFPTLAVSAGAYGIIYGGIVLMDNEVRSDLKKLLCKLPDDE